jgi:hypothetical protein
MRQCFDCICPNCRRGTRWRMCCPCWDCIAPLLCGLVRVGVGLGRVCLGADFWLRAGGWRVAHPTRTTRLAQGLATGWTKSARGASPTRGGQCRGSGWVRRAHGAKQASGLAQSCIVRARVLLRVTRGVLGLGVRACVCWARGFAVLVTNAGLARGGGYAFRARVEGACRAQGARCAPGAGPEAARGA